jgi:para-aminobenzoate synthetase component 1
VIITAIEQWRDWSCTFRHLPAVARFDLPAERLISWEQAWRMAGDQAFVLESGKMGRYTFFGLQPVSVIRGKADLATVTETATGLTREVVGKPLSLVKEWMAGFTSPPVEGAPKFIGGCVGFWGYDVIRSIEKLPEWADDDLGLPDYCLMRFDRLWILDHERHELYCACHTTLTDNNDSLEPSYHLALQTLEEMKRQWDAIASVQDDAGTRERHARMMDMVEHGPPIADVDADQTLQRSLSKDGYVDAVKRIQSYIAAGDVFQVNLAVRQSRRLSAAPEQIYEWLRWINPSPYMGLLKFGDFSLVSGSPELLVQLEGNQVRTRPIAGTRPRGADPTEDMRLAQELIDNEKERAEHVMLVDLERNDLGKISRYGTVRVDELMAIEYYSHVMHIVSEVQGELAAGKDAYDVLAATFPGGTITGAPKIRTMEIIEELEPFRRGPYTGSFGWIDYNGNMEFNIIIRTLVVKDGYGHVQAGAGIVIDSVPEKEYIESLNKAKALWKAIQYSEQEGRS